MGSTHDLFRELKLIIMVQVNGATHVLQSKDTNLEFVINLMKK